MTATAETKQFAQKKLDEMLKRGKPKNVKKLYELFVKESGKENANSALLDIISAHVTEVAPGRLKLDEKEASKTVDARLKEVKDGHVPQYFPKKAETKPEDGSKFFPQGDGSGGNVPSFFKGEAQTPLDEFAISVSELSMSGLDIEAAELYQKNQNLFFDSMRKDIEACGKSPVTFGDLDKAGNHAFFYNNVLGDMDIALANAAVDNASNKSVYIDYLKTLLAMPIDWKEEHNEYCNFMAELIERLITSDKQKEADALAEQWRAFEKPGTCYPERGILWGLMSKNDEASKKEAVSIADHVLETRKTFETDEREVLYPMEALYDKIGDTKKRDAVHDLIMKWKF